MPHRRYNINWVGRCQFEGSDKIWGWFIYKDPTSSIGSKTSSDVHAYTFWARTGKTPSFKKHLFASWGMGKLVQKKKDRNYQEISVNDLLELWPTLYNDFENKFIFHLLANDI